MTFLTIRDADARLERLLELAGADVARSEWTVASVECVGESAGVLHMAADDGRAIGGMELMELVGRVTQVIDGTFSAHLPEQAQEWIVIRAVDSTCFDVETERVEILAAIRGRFADVREIPKSTRSPVQISRHAPTSEIFQMQIGITFGETTFYITLDAAKDATRAHPWWSRIVALLRTTVREDAAWRTFEDDDFYFWRRRAHLALREQLLAELKTTPLEVRREKKSIEYVAGRCGREEPAAISLTFFRRK